MERSTKHEILFFSSPHRPPRKMEKEERSGKCKLSEGLQQRKS